MPRMPSSSIALLTLNDALQTVELRSSEKSRFRGGRLEMKGEFEFWQKILMGVFGRIWPHGNPSIKQAEMGEDLLYGVFDHFRALELLSTQIRTWRADERQVLWLALTRIIAPGVGRRLGYWTLDFDADAEMPGGALWFLPQIDDAGALRLPMSSACDHLVELARSRGISLEGIFTGEHAEADLRRFQSWRLERVLPGVDLMMKTLDGAIANLDLGKNADTLNRRFLTARAVQWAHPRLVEALTPGIPATHTNPRVNKALQVWALLRLSHDLTVKAGAGAAEESQARFHALIPEAFQDEVFASMIVSPFFQLEILADRLSDRCAMLEPGADLENLFNNYDLTLPCAPEQRRLLPAHDELGQIFLQMTASLHSDHTDREKHMRLLLKEALVHPQASLFAADLAMFEALHELNKGNSGPALTRIDDAWHACTISWPGEMAGRIAHLRLGLGALHGKPQEVSGRARDCLRLMSREEAASVCLPEDPQYALEDLTRNAAHSVRHNEMRLYPSAARSSGGDAFQQALSDLLNRHRRGDDLTAWVKRHRAALTGRPDPVTRETGLMMLWKGAWNADNGGLPPQAGPALRAGVLEAMRRLPHKVLEAFDWKRQTLLTLATDGHDREAFNILIERQVTLDAQDFLGRTALHAAALSGEEDLFIQLLDRGADPTMKTCVGNDLLRDFSSIRD